jgi:hypothetical protein
VAYPDIILDHYGPDINTLRNDRGINISENMAGIANCDRIPDQNIRSDINAIIHPEDTEQAAIAPRAECDCARSLEMSITKNFIMPL